MNQFTIPDSMEKSNRTTMMMAVGSPAKRAAVSVGPGSQQKPLSIRDSLASSIIHDLRNPLAAIRGCAEMLLTTSLAPAQTRRVTTNIHRAADRMRKLLLEFAYITRGHADITEICNLRVMIEAACEAVGRQDGIEILLAVPACIELPLARTRMERVFVNLVVNAMEAMPAGGQIRITARERGDGVLINVEDTGPGIPPEIRGRLFEPFATAGKKDGLGLGLTLSRQTVRDHGGDLWAEDATGARFVVFLPRSGPSAGPSGGRILPINESVWNQENPAAQ